MQHLVVVVALLCLVGCQRDQPAHDAPTPTGPVDIPTVRASQETVARTFQVTGTLQAEEQAEVGAETTGRIVETPVERGTEVKQGAVLVRLLATETEAQLREAEANAAQLEAKLGLDTGHTLELTRVPEVLAARSALDLAESEFARVQSLRDRQLVSQADFDQRRAQRDSARQQLQVAQNTAEQAYRSLEAARARVAVARKALDDTVVRAPFAGTVAERRVSVGDYATRGTIIATVVRVNPLRAQLTVPESLVGRVSVNQAVSIAVDAYPGRRFDGHIRFVSPALRADQRALTVEAIVPNASGELKPGMFATAAVSASEQAVVITLPQAAVHVSAGTPRVFVVTDGHLEERLITTGQTVGDRIEIVTGVQAEDEVAIAGARKLADGIAVRPQPVSNTSGRSAPVRPGT